MPKPPGVFDKDRIPLLTVLDPRLLWLFSHGWEDPEWGKRTIDQHTIGIILHEIAGAINDPQVKKEIMTITSSFILSTSEQIVKDSE